MKGRRERFNKYKRAWEELEEWFSHTGADHAKPIPEVMAEILEKLTEDKILLRAEIIKSKRARTGLAKRCEHEFEAAGESVGGIFKPASEGVR